MQEKTDLYVDKNTANVEKNTLNVDKKWEKKATTTTPRATNNRPPKGKQRENQTEPSAPAKTKKAKPQR